MSGTTTQATGNGTTQHAPPRGRSGAKRRHRRTKAELAAARAASEPRTITEPTPAPVVRVARDPELMCMNTIASSLDALPIAERTRVVTWIDARYSRALLKAA